MINKLKELPALITKQRTHLLELQNDLEENISSISNWESKVKQDIADETDAKGKAVFSNAEKRQVELDRRKSEDELISQYVDNVKILKFKIDNLRIEMQFNIDTQENLRAIARLGGDLN